MSFEQEFLQTCMQNMQDGLPAEQALKACSWVHFHANRMEEVLAPLKGDLDGFLAFLSREWGWVITQCGEKILVDENKNYCVCPLRQAQKMPPLLCNCSEGFAERMFSYILNRPVRATVTASILRGDKSCKYEIVL
jgi:hypothetical protein